MRPCLLGIWLSLLAAGAPAAGQDAATPIRFAPLPVEKPVTTMSITEDGKFLLLAHEADGQITVWDVAAGKAHKTLKVPNPRYIFCRGGKAYIANHGQGTVTVVDPARDFRIANQHPVGAKWPYFITAPGGKHFDGKLYVSCNETMKVDGNERAMTTLRRVDTAKDANAEMITVRRTWTRVWTSSWRGHFLLNVSYHSANRKPFVSPQLLDTARLPGDEHDVTWHESDTNSVDAFYTVALAADDSGLWVGPQTVLDGATPHPVAGIEPGRIALPDATAPRAYLLRDDHLAAVELARPVREIGRKPAEPPEVGPVPQTMSDWPWFAHIGRDSLPWLKTEDLMSFRYIHVPARAATLNGTLHLFVPAPYQGKIYHARTAAFAPGPPAPAPPPEPLGQRRLWDRAKGRHHMEFSHDHLQLLLVNGPELWILDAGARNVLRRVQLDRMYRKIFSRPNYFLGLATDGAVHLIDPDTGLTRRRIVCELGPVEDLAPWPSGAVSYLTWREDKPGIPEKSCRRLLAKLDESTGEIESMPNVLARWIVTDPMGRWLIAAFWAEYEGGMTLDVPQYRDNVRPNSQFDFVARYTPDGKMLEYNESPGMDGRGLRMSADGKYVHYLCETWRNNREKPGRRSPTWAANKLNEGLGQHYGKLRSGGSMVPPTLLAFHPRSGLVATSYEEQTLQLFNIRGDLIPNGFHDTLPDKSDIRHMSFTPDGRGLVVLHDRRNERRHAEPWIATLRLKGGAVAGLPAHPAGGRPAPTPPRANPTPRPPRATPPPARPNPPRKQVEKPALADLGALTADANPQRMSRARIAEACGGAVGTVQSGRRFGVGVFVGVDGYMVIPAGLADAGQPPAVAFRVKVADRWIDSRDDAADVVAVDEKLGLALVKVGTPMKATIVRLAGPGRPSSGDPVTMIGQNPSGLLAVDHRLTGGIISNPRQKVDGQEWLQTDAPSGPGSAGAPLFDEFGRLVGIVIGAGKIEKTTFAAPADRVADFLKRNTRKE